MKSSKLRSFAARDPASWGMLEIRDVLLAAADELGRYELNRAEPDPVEPVGVLRFFVADMQIGQPVDFSIPVVGGETILSCVLPGGDKAELVFRRKGG